PEGGSVTVLGLGPIGLMACRIAAHRGAGRVIGVDLVSDRLHRASQDGFETIDLNGTKDVVSAVRDRSEGRGTDSVIDAVGMEAHGSPVGHLAHQITSLLPDSIAQRLMSRA